MNNLKRVLSLALTGAMLVGTMLVGASAVNGKDFTDKAEIKHNEAVDTLVTLNVINGKDDGSYDPTGSLTRAEMAKLIVYTLNGGAEPVMSTKATPTYTDIKGHWAEKYIEYCSNLGIIAGRGDGTFDPAGILTGSQAAKMMLVAMNYDSNVFGFTGADWELNVNHEANDAGLYDDLRGMDPSATITRDEAAQLVYNGMLAGTMKRTYGQNMSTGAISQNYELTGDPLFTTKFNGTSYEGVLVSTGKYTLATNPVREGNPAVTGNGTDRFVIAQTKIGNVSLPTTGEGAIALGTTANFKYTEDLSSLMGKSVRVLYNTKDRTVYGVYSIADNNTVVVESTTDAVEDVKTDTIKIDGDVYDKVNGLQVYVDGVAGTNDDLTAGARTVTFVDYDGDEKLDIALVNKVASYKVSYVGSTTFTLGNLIAGDDEVLTSASQKLSEVDYYEGMKKDDIVFVTKNLFDGKDLIEKAEITSATITGKRSNGALQIDGSWYDDFTVETPADTDLDLGDSVEFAAKGGLIYYAKVTSATKGLSDMAMLITYTLPTGGNGILDNQVKLMFSDGSTSTVVLDKIRDAADANDVTINDDALVCGDLYTFSVKNGKYTLYQMPTSSDYTENAGKVGDFVALKGTAALPAADAKATQIKDGDTKPFDVADDAVIFLYSGTDNGAAANKGKIITGKELKSITVKADTDPGVKDVNNALYKSANGFQRIAVASVNSTTSTWPVASTSANYGYVVAAPFKSTVNGDKYITYKVWNGTETVDYREKTDNDIEAAKGMVIGYDVVDSETIKNVSVILKENSAYAVTGKDGNDLAIKDLAGDTTNVKLDGDTKYLYVNSKASAADEIGVEGGEVVRCTNNGVDVMNVRVLLSGTTVKLIVVDTNNDMALLAAEKKDLTVTSLAAGLVLTVNDTEYTEDTEKVMAPGDIVRITNTTDATITTAAKPVDKVVGADDIPTEVVIRAGESVTYIATGEALTVTAAAKA